MLLITEDSSNQSLHRNWSNSIEFTEIWWKMAILAPMESIAHISLVWQTINQEFINTMKMKAPTETTQIN